jgi:hypothetical protein
MKTSPNNSSSRLISAAFLFKKLEGKFLYGLGGKLTNQPCYQHITIRPGSKGDVAFTTRLLIEEVIKD